jgi:prepilin-type processing-associated H-X9-DG protein
MKLYAEDNGGRFPCDPEATTVGSMALLAGKYVKSHAPTRTHTIYHALVCPDDLAHVFARIAPGSPKKPLTSKNISYAYGGFCFADSISPDSPLACDRSSTGTWTNAKPWDRNKWTHGSSGGNVLLADGRVSFSKWKVGTMDAIKNP